MGSHATEKKKRQRERKREREQCDQALFYKMLKDKGFNVILTTTN